MATENQWRIATQRKGHVGRSWDIGYTRMSEKMARAVASRLNKKYPNYTHRAVKDRKK